MAKWNPCCFPLVSSLKKIAQLQMARSGTSILTFVVFLGFAIHIHASHPESPFGGIIAILILHLLLELIQFYLAISLWKGAVQRNHSKCQRWFFGTLCLFTFNLVLTIIGWINQDEPNLMLPIIFIIIDIYSLVAVFAFLDELTSDPTAAGLNA